MSLQGADIFSSQYMPILNLKSTHLSYSCHLNEYWMLCVENNITPLPPKDWMPPASWRPPNEKQDESSSTTMKQQSITRFTEKKSMQAVSVTKQGIKEHLLAIITMCDLVIDLPFIVTATHVHLLQSFR